MILGRMAYINADTHEQAFELAPWAEAVTECHGGKFLAFADTRHYLLYKLSELGV